MVAENIIDVGAEVKGISLAPNANQKLFGQIKALIYATTLNWISWIKSNLKMKSKSFVRDYFSFSSTVFSKTKLRSIKETYLTNVIGTLNLFEAVKLLNIKCNIIVVTTDKVYENIEQEYLYKESDRLGGYDPYSSSKAACEVLVSSYRNSFLIRRKIRLIL